jgi:HAD superfamily hydrolase (TIGR01509 family)
LENIKNIIFDLGGVLLHINYQKTILAFKDLGVENFDELFSQMKQTPVFDEFEVGKISSEQFADELNRKIKNASQQQIFEAWNAMLGGLKEEEFVLLKKIKTRYNIYLLSNTNQLHLEWISKHVEHYNQFESLFLATHYSHQLGKRKPDQKTFEALLQLHKLEAEQTLFIDDTAIHVEGARKAGLHAIHLDISKGESLSLHFNSNGHLR